MAMPRLFCLIGLLLAGCAYDPPLTADHAAPAYRNALARCQKDVYRDASRKANATPSSAVESLFTSDEPQRQAIRACMQHRGYA